MSEVPLTKPYIDRIASYRLSHGILVTPHLETFLLYEDLCLRAEPTIRMSTLGHKATHKPDFRSFFLRQLFCTQAS